MEWGSIRLILSGHLTDKLVDFLLGGKKKPLKQPKKQKADMDEVGQKPNGAIAAL